MYNGVKHKVLNKTYNLKEFKPHRVSGLIVLLLFHMQSFKSSKSKGVVIGNL